MPGPGRVHRTERHSRVEEPETDVNTQSGCVGAASVALAGWGLFSSAWATQPVVSLLWILMPCSVHVGCINTPACLNTLQMSESEFERYEKGRELRTLEQGPVRFVKVTHRLVNYKKTWTSIIKLGKQCMNKRRISTKK